MAFQVSPGINVTEIDLTTIVPSVATTIGGIAGFYEWGPANQITIVDSPKTYRETFGDPRVWNFKQWFSGTNFLGYGRTLLVSRAVASDARNSVAKVATTASLTGLNESTFEVVFSGMTDGSKPTWIGVGSTAFFGPDTAPTDSRNLSLDLETSFSATASAVTSPTTETGNTTVVYNYPVEYSSFDLPYFVDYVKGFFADNATFGVTGSDVNFYATDATGSDTLGLTSGTFDEDNITLSNYSFTQTFPIATDTSVTGSVKLIPNPNALDSATQNGVFARFPGEKGDSLKISVFGGNATTEEFKKWQYWNLFGTAPESSDNLVTFESGVNTNDQFHMVVIDEDGLFTGTKGTILERFGNLSVYPQGRRTDGSVSFYKGIINNESSYVIVGGNETPEDSITDFKENQFGVTGGFVTTSSGTYVTTWGSGNGYVFSDFRLLGGKGQTGANSQIIQTVPSSTPSGYNLFEDKENVNISLLIGGEIGEYGQTFVENLKGLAQYRTDCVAFVSSLNKSDEGTENSKEAACLEMKNWVGSSSYVVIDSGYKYQYDAYNDRFRWIPLNADIAGLVARTDLTNDPWFSPAGLNRGQIRNSVKLAFNPTKTFRDAIYTKGINPVISTPGQGTYLFGDKTALSKPSAFDRINVRRLFIVLEKAISTASKYSLFEFNDAFTRQQFRSLVEPFLRDVKARRGVFDWKVVCDETNNTPEIIDRNEFVADIYIKPTRSINFIQLNFIATRTGVSFAEVGA